MNKYLIIAVACLLCGCAAKEKETEELRSVYVVDATGGNDSSVKKFAGIVEEDCSVSLGFKTAGQIKRIYVKEGDRVKAGQLLAELDNADYKLGVEALQIQYDQLSDEVARAKRLFEKKSMSANDYEKAAAGLRQLGVQLQVNKNKLAYTRLYAPTAGVIETVNFSPAEMVDAGTAVFSMLDLKNMEVVCDIPAKTYLERSRFSSFSCTPTHDSTKEFPLRLLSIVPKADGNQLYRMHLAFDKSTGNEITAGMNVEVTVNLSAVDNEVRVPASSVFRSGKEECVWIVTKDSTIKKQPVTIDPAASAKTVRVISGLSGGETVVRAGASSLHEGEKIRILSEASETNVGGLL